MRSRKTEERCPNKQNQNQPNERGIAQPGVARLRSTGKKGTLVPGWDREEAKLIRCVGAALLSRGDLNQKSTPEGARLRACPGQCRANCSISRGRGGLSGREPAGSFGGNEWRPNFILRRTVATEVWVAGQYATEMPSDVRG